ncbi:MAG: hypothetical protein RL693_1595, partial [Verrucomicrobiota bacterium]
MLEDHQPTKLMIILSRKHIIFGTCFLLVASTIIAAEWENPARSITVELKTQIAAGVDVQVLKIGSQALQLLGHSNIRRENHGFAWLESTPAHWVSDQFLVFQDDLGLCLVDAVGRKVLLNQVFTGFTKSPNADKWAAIRYRPTARDQEKLTGSERDTLWIIDPESLA